MEYLHLGWSLEDCRESGTVEAREGGSADRAAHTGSNALQSSTGAYVLHVLAPTSIQHAEVAAQCTGKAPGAPDPLWLCGAGPVEAAPCKCPLPVLL